MKETIWTDGQTDGEDIEIYRAAIAVKNEKSELFNRATNFECFLVLFHLYFFVKLTNPLKEQYTV